MTVFFDRSSTAEALGNLQGFDAPLRFWGSEFLVCFGFRVNGLEAGPAKAHDNSGKNSGWSLGQGSDSCAFPWQKMLDLFCRASATPLRRCPCQRPDFWSQCDYPWLVRQYSYPDNVGRAYDFSATILKPLSKTHLNLAPVFKSYPHIVNSIFSRNCKPETGKQHQTSSPQTRPISY